MIFSIIITQNVCDSSTNVENFHIELKNCRYLYNIAYNGVNLDMSRGRAHCNTVSSLLDLNSLSSAKLKKNNYSLYCFYNTNKD